jgi:uncharacterized protein YndB with AHSA1/START domain
MKTKNLIATAKATVNAPLEEVWNALITPDIIKKYMFGATVISDFKEGSNIIWKGEWKGTAFEDKGFILEVLPCARLSYSHYSPLTGDADVAENYHTVTIELAKTGDKTVVSLRQDNTKDEKAKKHSEKNWQAMLDSLNEVLSKKA